MKILNLPPQSSNRELSPTQYFLVVSSSGDVLLTKFKPEAVEVSSWNNIIFKGIVDRANQSILYKIRGSDLEHIKKLRELKVSDPYSKSWAFDFENLDHSNIVFIEIIKTRRKSQREALI